MQKNSITSKISPCCNLPFSVVYWWVSNLTLNSEADRTFILSKISQNGSISIDAWKILINSGTLEDDAILTKAEFLAWFDCERQPSCAQLKLLINNYKLGNWTPEIDDAILKLIDDKFEEIGTNYNLGVINSATPAPPNDGMFLGQVFNAGTFPNFGGITVTEEELKDNFVFIFVKNGVFSKELTEKKDGIELASFLDPLNSVDAIGGKQVNDWLFGFESDYVFGSNTSLNRANSTNTAPNATVTYWMYNYLVPYSDSVLRELKISMQNAGLLFIKRYKKVGGSYLFQNQFAYNVLAGENTIDFQTKADYLGNINDLWDWQSDDVIAVFSSAGIKYTADASPYNGLYGNGLNPGNTTDNFSIASLSGDGGGILMSLKFVEVLEKSLSGQVVDEINFTNSGKIPNVKAVLDYVKNSEENDLTDIILIPSYGQSLSIGTDGGASTFATPVDIALNINGVNSNVQDMNGGYVETFKEMASQNNIKLPSGFKIMTCLGGEGGKSISQLSKGSIYYTTLINNITTAKATADSLGKSFSVPAFCWTQGEEDYRAGGVPANYGTGNFIPTEYAEKLKVLIDDLNTDIIAITGQNTPVKCVMYQLASHNPYGRYPRIALEQLKATINDERVTLAKTMYDVDYNASDYVHAPNKTYRNMGNFYGISLFDAIVLGEKRLPIYPVKNTRVGNSIYIQFHVPVKPLQFDETFVLPLSDGNKGFNLVTVNNEFSTGATISQSIATITGVSLVNSDTVKIDFSTNPLAGTRLTYGVNGDGWNAINGTPLGTAKSGRIVGARGNLRDNQTFFNPVANYFNLYNYCVIFEIIL